MSNPFFSVVIPLYNKADVVARTLGSVCAQTFRDFELIIVDDGSTDGSVGVVEESLRGASCEYRLIKQGNAGVSVARNKGVEESQGKYIAFLDADDEWMPEYLWEIKTAVDKNPTAKVLGSGYVRYAGKYCYSCRSRSRMLVCNLFDVWPFFQPMNSSCYVVEKATFVSVGGYTPGLSFWEDGELWFRLAEHNHFYIVRKPLAKYTSDSCKRATRANPLDKDSAPHIKFLYCRMLSGHASNEMKRCYALMQRDRAATLLRDPLFWVYKRIRFYLWFSRSKIK